jgi:hypothetical protein
MEEVTGSNPVRPTKPARRSLAGFFDPELRNVARSLVLFQLHKTTDIFITDIHFQTESARVDARIG